MKKARQLWESYTFLMPSFILTIILGVYPIFWAMRYMFYDYSGYGTARFIGLGNFSRLWRDDDFWNSVVNTFIYAGGKLIVTLPLALLLAVILNHAIRGRQLLRGIYFMPTIISNAVMAVVFFIIFNSYNGVLNQFLTKYHIASSNIDWLGPKYAMLTTIIVAIWGAIGNYMILFLAGLQGIPDDLYESSSLDGANKAQQFWYITIPMLGPIMQMVILLAIIISLKGYESIMVLTGGGPIGKTEVMYLYVYKLFFPFNNESSPIEQIGYGSAAGFATALIVGVITIIYFMISRRLNRIF